MNLPWLKFYPADWRSDPALRLCNMAARGLWMEMLCLMHEAEPYGHLVVKGVPVRDTDLARIAAINLKECRKLVATLEKVGVFSRSPEGHIYSRRMVRDHAKALKDKDNGSKGGNPRLKGGDNPQHKAQRPEARSQVPDKTLAEPSELYPSPSKADSASSAARPANDDWDGFNEGKIRLNHQQLEAWERDYPHLSLVSELRSLVQYAGQEAAKGNNWFFAVSGALAKRNREAGFRSEQIKAEAEARANAPIPIRKPAGWVP